MPGRGWAHGGKVMIAARPMLALLLCTACGSAVPRGPTPFDPAVIPRGPAPTIDGRVSAGEWMEAAARPLRDGGTVTMQHDGAYLYLAVRAARPGFPSVCVITGDTVRILHASASVAEGRYRIDGTLGHLSQPFQFELRERGGVPAEASAFRQFLDRHGWVASTHHMGSGSASEMQIPFAYLRGDAPRLTVAWYYLEDGVAPQSTHWPIDLADGCAAIDVIRGPLPDSATFDTTQWASVTFR